MAKEHKRLVDTINSLQQELQQTRGNLAEVVDEVSCFSGNV